ncbi:MAG: HPr family phosphocarrier protein [Acidobacteria bacterium]|nr:HPr family phosphocarrier protein [Acidobacteriota bacterium]MBK8150363.1 HPr family phosphocarrier protein [Acidobacteriota bacterium]MBK8811360.1 HPr family phosphocarrier protein [Acidobacteriota bacterium]
MLKDRVVIINDLGLHARAAAQLVRLASGFRSRIRLYRLDNSVIADAKSILSVLTLAASKGVALELEIDGEDEKIAMDSVVSIFANGFGEM